MAAVIKQEEYWLVVGLGSSGLAAARHLAGRGEPVQVVDSRAHPPALDALRASCPSVQVSLETLSTDWLAHAGRLVVSPGLASDLPLLEEARRRGIPIASEIELFACAARAPVIAVTGSNGKSTVTSLTADILEAQGFVAPRGGNLGPPALELLEVADAEAYVLEISSFQMEATRSLKPRAATVLNVSADHLDRHGSVERYAALKEALLEGAEQAVYNWDDPLVRPMGQRHPQSIPFSVQERLPVGWSVVVHERSRWLARDGEPLIAANELALHGRLGEANSLAALALAESMGGERAAALDVLRRFAGLPHRCQLVTERGGVRYIDDSKGTNVGAAIAALEAADGTVVLIAGGLAKGADFAPLAAAAEGRVRAAVLIGEAAPALEAAFAGRVMTYRASSMDAAVAKANAVAASGDTVLLSPACASQDMFRDYRDRGEAFARAVTGAAS
jgi:UDP-N-acetylmuramoylalanine--D-glutamate ligase